MRILNYCLTKKQSKKYMASKLFKSYVKYGYVELYSISSTTYLGNQGTLYYVDPIQLDKLLSEMAPLASDLSKAEHLKECIEKGRFKRLN